MRAKTKRIKTPDGLIRYRPDRPKPFQIDCRDSDNGRYRPSFDTEEEARAELQRIAGRKSKGEFLRNATNTTFGEALDLLLARNVRDGLEQASRRRVESVVRAHLRPKWGDTKLDYFVKTRMQPVQEWLDDLKQQRNLAEMTLKHIHSAIKLTFKAAIKAGRMHAPNPVNQFELAVPKNSDADDFERDPLTFDEIVALLRATMRRAEREHELTWRSRFLLVLLGFLCRPPQQ